MTHKFLTCVDPKQRFIEIMMYTCVDPKQRFIEIMMYGNTTSNRFFAALSSSDAGYIKLYDKNGVNGWSITQPIIIYQSMVQR